MSKNFKLEPEHFGRSMLEQAHRLLKFSLNRSSGHELDPKTAYWVIRSDHKRHLLEELDVGGVFLRPAPITLMTSCSACRSDGRSATQMERRNYNSLWSQCLPRGGLSHD